MSLLVLESPGGKTRHTSTLRIPVLPSWEDWNLPGRRLQSLLQLGLKKNRKEKEQKLFFKQQHSLPPPHQPKEKSSQVRVKTSQICLFIGKSKFLAFQEDSFLLRLLLLLSRFSRVQLCAAP